MKRTKNITLHITEEEMELLQAIADKTDRKPAELARLLLMRQAFQEWQKLSVLHSGELVPNYKGVER